jgi:hypothetical protein
VNEDLAKALELALVELSHLRTVKRLSDEEKAALNQKIVALEDLVTIERRRAEAYKSANAERAIANDADAVRVALLERMIADYKTERERLMKEREAARRYGRYLGVIGFVAGVLITVFVKGRN